MRLLFSLPWLMLAPLMLTPAAALAQPPTQTQAETTAPDRPILQPGSEGNAVMEVQALLTLLGFYRGAVDGQYSEDTAAAVARFQQQAGVTVDGIVGPATWSRLLPTIADGLPPSSEARGAESDPSVVETTADGTTAEGAAADADLSDSPHAGGSPGEGDSAEDGSPHLGMEAGAEVGNAAPAPSPEAAPTAETVPVELPILRMGMEGPAVVRLQQRLRTLGTYSGSLDGIFGPETERGVIQVQRNAGIEADGIVGPVTWSVLLR